MLKQLSRLEKTRNIILLAFVVLMAVSLVFFYAPRQIERADNIGRSQETVATVGSETVTLGQLATTRANIEKRNEAQAAAYGGQFKIPAPPVKQVLDGEISQALIRQEARRLNLMPTDDEVATTIRKQLVAGKMDPNDTAGYTRVVTENYGSVENFENNLRDQLAQEKVSAFLTSGVSISENEIVDTYRRQNTDFQLVYVPVVGSQIAEKLQISDDEARKYFNDHKQIYYISSPQKKIRYVFINQNKAGEKLEIPEADVKAEYDALPADKKEQGVGAQQIVLKITNPADDSKVLTNANNIVAQLRGGDATRVVTEQAFAEIARGKSEDPKTAQNGGKLAVLVKEDKKDPDNPLQNVLDLQTGQITEPIKFGNNYYIFRRGDAVAKTFELAKKEIEVSLRNRRAYKVAADLAQKADARLKETNDVQKVAQEFAAQANMKPEEMIRETGYVKQGDDIKDIGSSPQFENGIGPLETIGQVGEVTPIKEGFALPVLVDKKDPRDADFDEVKDKVIAAAKIETAKARLEQTAKDLANGSNTPDALKAAATKIGLKATDAPTYKLGSPLGEGANAATSAALDEAIYNLKPNEVTKTPIKAGDNYYVVGLVKRTDADMQAFAKQRDDQVESALSLKKGQVFTDYLADLRQRFEKEGRIKIEKTVLAKLNGATATDEG